MFLYPSAEEGVAWLEAGDQHWADRAFRLPSRDRGEGEDRDGRSRHPLDVRPGFAIPGPPKR